MFLGSVGGRGWVVFRFGLLGCWVVWLLGCWVGSGVSQVQPRKVLRLQPHKDRNQESVTAECSDGRRAEDARGVGFKKDGMWQRRNKTHHSDTTAEPVLFQQINQRNQKKKKKNNQCQWSHPSTKANNTQKALCLGFACFFIFYGTQPPNCITPSLSLSLPLLKQCNRFPVRNTAKPTHAHGSPLRVGRGRSVSPERAGLVSPSDPFKRAAAFLARSRLWPTLPSLPSLPSPLPLPLPCWCC